MTRPTGRIVQSVSAKRVKGLFFIFVERLKVVLRDFRCAPPTRSGDDAVEG
jgi:hypothetical protein